MKKKLSKKILTVVLALAAAFSTTGLTSFASDTLTDPTVNHGTVSVTTQGKSSLNVGDSMSITISPYIHVQYQGCSDKDTCPGTCGETMDDCFTVGKGCSCMGLDPYVRTASVSVTSSDPDVVEISEISQTGDCDEQVVGSMADGTMKVTAKKAGTTTITVKASLRDWISAEKTFDLTIAGDSSTENNVVSAGSKITTGGIYQLDPDASDGTVSIATTDPVTIIGSGIDDTQNDYLTIDCTVPGVNLTIQDLRIDSATEQPTNALKFTGAGNQLILKGTNLLQQCYQQGPFDSVINVPRGAELTISGDGVLYLYKHAYGAATIGGDQGQASGTIEFAGGTVLIFTTMGGVAVGSDTEVGDIIFSGGEVCMESDDSSPLIGSNSSADAGNVYVMGGTVALNNGAYSSIGSKNGSDGNLIITGGSLLNAGNTGISADITDEKGNSLYLCRILLGSEKDKTSYTITVDGKTYYSGKGHIWAFNGDRTSVISKAWEQLKDPALYLYLTGEDHKISFNGIVLYAEWEEESQSFTLSDTVPGDQPETSSTGEIVDFDAYTDHSSEVMLDDITDMQTAYISLTFDQQVKIVDEDALIDEMSSSMTLGGQPVNGEEKKGKIGNLSLSNNGKTLNFTISGWWAPFNGRVLSSGIWNNLITVDGNGVDSSVNFIIPNGMETVITEQIIADEEMNASVTTRIVKPNSATRGMIHLVVLKNGQPVGTLNDNNAMATGHCHDYLNMTSEQFVEWYCSAIQNAVGDDYIVEGEGDSFVITAKDSEVGDVLELHIGSYLNDGSKTIDAQKLNDAISGAQSLDISEYTEKSWTSMTRALRLAQIIAADTTYYAQTDVDRVAAQLKKAVTLLRPVGSADLPAWVKDNTGWWYLLEDGSYPANQWKLIGGKWYHFDARGYMQSGWQKISNKWYYLGSANDGSMKSSWQKINNKWYYFGSANDGAMKSGWQKINNKWYYLGSANDGAMKTGWQLVNGKWYYLYSSGAMAENTWIGNYYVDASGAWVPGK